MKSNSFLGQVIQVFGVRIIGIVLAIPSSIFLARGLVPTTRGEYTLILTSIAIVSLFSGMGLAPANVRFAAKYPNLRGVLLGNSLFYSIIIGIVVILVLLPFGNHFSLNHFTSMIIGLLVSLTLFSGYSENILLGSQLISKYNIAQLVQYITGLAAFLIVYFTYPGIWSFVVAYTITLASKCIYVLIVLCLSVQIAKPCRKILWKQIKFGLPLHLSTMLRRLSDSIAVYLLKAFCGDAAVGYLAIPKNYLVRAKILPRTIASLLLPRVAADDEDKLAEQAAMLLRITLLFFLGMAIILAFIIPTLFNLLYGSTYHDAIPAGQILIFAFPLFSFNQIASNYLIGRGRTRFFLWMSIYGFSVGLASLLILLPQWGIKGAALATVNMELASFIYCLITMRKETEFSFRVLLIPSLGDGIYLFGRLRQGLQRQSDKFNSLR